MNAKLIASAVALALLGSTNLFAEQKSGRSSIYATPGSSSSRSTTLAVSSRQGRSSVYVGDVAAPTAKSTTVADTEILKHGRA